MCDVKNYMYMPLLEETGYVPKHRFSYSEEIREYIELLAKKYELNDSAVFLTTVKEMAWGEDAKGWQAQLVQRRGRLLRL